jgi:hypothetical protein
MLRRGGRVVRERHGLTAPRERVPRVDEVVDGGWGIGGNVLSLAMLKQDA